MSHFVISCGDEMLVIVPLCLLPCSPLFLTHPLIPHGLHLSIALALEPRIGGSDCIKYLRRVLIHSGPNIGMTGQLSIGENLIQALIIVRAFMPQVVDAYSPQK